MLSRTFLSQSAPFFLPVQVCTHRNRDYYLYSLLSWWWLCIMSLCQCQHKWTDRPGPCTLWRNRVCYSCPERMSGIPKYLPSIHSTARWKKIPSTQQLTQQKIYFLSIWKVGRKNRVEMFTVRKPRGMEGWVLALSPTLGLFSQGLEPTDAAPTFTVGLPSLVKPFWRKPVDSTR